MSHMSVDPSNLLNQIYSNVTDLAIFTFDTAARITSWNAGAQAMFGYRSEEAVGSDSSRIYTPEDLASGYVDEEMSLARKHGRAVDHRRHVRSDGSRFWADGVLAALCGDGGELVGYLKIVRDATASKLAEDGIHRLGSVDGLTGLSNRAYFDLRRAEMMALSARTGELMLLLTIDLDRFKEVNDMFGHHAGDLLLRQAAQRIRSVSRDSDLIARLGGDEFAVLQLNPASASAGAVLASKLLAVLAEPFVLDGQEAHISASIGIAVCPGDTRSSDDLLKKADLALYQAKNAGRNCFHYFTQELDDAAHQRNRDQLALRRATAAKAFYLVYQPVIDAGSGKTTAFEALLRTSAPDLAHYPVSYLIDLAVEIGLISDIGEWVFSEACRQLKQWKQAGLTRVRMAVNTCARELLDPHYVARLEGCLREYGLGADELEIELTERDAIELQRVGSAVLDRLKSDGFRLVLDDFGTGYSSLSYLRALPVSAIKLDKSFLIGIPQSDDASAVVRAVITLTHDLKLEVTAEGVEFPAQAGFLRDLACTAFQGYLFCTPLNAEAASAWLADNGASPEQRVH